MRILRLCLFFLFFSFFCHADAYPKTFLLTFPRSGTHWMMYCLQTLTGRPWHVHNRNLLKWIDFENDENMPYLYHTHYIRCLASPNRDKDFLIVLLRNYKECFLRQYGSYDAMQRELKGKGFYYFENLKYFDSWAPDKRILIYYEDLMADSKSEVTRVLTLMGESLDGVEAFFVEVDRHRERVIQYYNRRYDGAESRGEDALYHSKSYPVEDLQKIDQIIQEAYPDLWQKYLKRYAS